MIEKRVRNYYEFCKVPGILFIPTDDPDALQEMWQKVREGTKDDPFTPAVLGVSETAPTNANFIKLMQDPNAELIMIKDELRTRIASVYGITLAFINDTSNTGGLKNDKNMISLSDRTIRTLQQTIDRKALRWITISMGITDWKLECEPNINDNKLEKEEVRAAQINNASQLAAMGLKVIWKGEEYTVGKGPLMSPEMMMMGMAPPGMGGGMAGPPMPPAMPMGGMPPMGGPAPGVPMLPDQMGGLTPSPPGPMGAPEGGLPALDVMAAGTAPPGGAPAPQPEPNFADTMRTMKDALGVTDGKKKTKKKVSTKLSRIMDKMFLTEDERNEKQKEEEEAEQAAAAPPAMPGMPGPMPGMGPAPMGMDSGMAPPGGAPGPQTPPPPPGPPPV
jgi:hypothetical protein